MTPAEKEALDLQARVHQMKINTRLTALQTGLELMKAPNYSSVVYKNDPNNPMIDSEPVTRGGGVDHITLLAMATDIEKYILGELEAEAQQAVEAAQKRANPMQIIKPHGLR